MMPSASEEFLSEALGHISSIRHEVRYVVADYRRQKAVLRSHELVDRAKHRLLVQAKDIVRARSGLMQQISNVVTRLSTASSRELHECLSSTIAAISEDAERCKISALNSKHSLSCGEAGLEVPCSLEGDVFAFEPVEHVLCGSGSTARFETPLTKSMFSLSDDDFVEVLFRCGQSLGDEGDTDSGLQLHGLTDDAALAEFVGAIAAGDDSAWIDGCAYVMACKRALCWISKDAKFTSSLASDATGKDCGAVVAVKWPNICRMDNIFYCLATLLSAVVDHELSQLHHQQQELLPSAENQASFDDVWRRLGPTSGWSDAWSYCIQFALTESIEKLRSPEERRTRAKLALGLLQCSSGLPAAPLQLCLEARVRQEAAAALGSKAS
jgi:hypothetical protein